MRLERARLRLRFSFSSREARQSLEASTRAVVVVAVFVVVDNFHGASLI